MKALLIFLVATMYMANAHADVYLDYEKHVYIQGSASLSIILGTDDNVIPATYPLDISLGYSKNYGDFEWGAAAGGAGVILPFISVVGEWHFLRMDNISFNLGGQIPFVYDWWIGNKLYIGVEPYLSTRLFFSQWYISFGVQYLQMKYGIKLSHFSLSTFVDFKNIAITLGTGFYF